ncbi:Universal stress protein E [compost metagenome]
MKLQHLLVVIDPTRDDQPALSRARWIAERSGARLSLLACDYSPALDNALLVAQRDLERARQNQQAERQAWLERIAGPLRHDGIDTSCHTLWGKPLYRQIIGHVEQHRPDLVLKSTSRHGLLKRLFLTNTDWQLIRHCPQPLWLVHQGEWSGQRLCTALDPLHESDKPAALDHRLIGISREFEQRLGLQAHYLHSYVALPQTLAFDTELLTNFDDYARRTREHHRQAFDNLLAQYPQIDRATAFFEEGFAEEVIPAFVRSHAIDLLLMGAVARGQLDNALIGQTAERVLEEVECDLLVVKPGE